MRQGPQHGRVLTPRSALAEKGNKPSRTYLMCDVPRWNSRLAWWGTFVAAWAVYVARARANSYKKSVSCSAFG